MTLEEWVDYRLSLGDDLVGLYKTVEFAHTMYEVSQLTMEGDDIAYVGNIDKGTVGDINTLYYHLESKPEIDYVVIPLSFEAIHNAIRKLEQLVEL